MSKVAIVLGTSSGIGQAVASSLLARGFLVYGGSRGESPIDHDNFVDVELDLTQKTLIENFIQEVQNDTEVVDVLVNAAGICEMNSFEDSTDLDLRMHLETNVIGYFNFLKKFEQLIISDETHIFNVYSISAKSYYPNTISYTTSEFAKKAMLGVIEKEWNQYGIRFSNFFVGAVDTPLWEDYSQMDTDKMLSIGEFIYMFNSILDAPKNIKFPDITFLNKDGFID